MREYEKMIAGLDYYPMNDEELVELRRISLEKTREFNAEPDADKREAILKSFLGKMGKGCYITPSLFCDYGCNLELEDNVYFNANCVVLDCAKVKIGENTFIGPNTQFYTPIGGSVVLLPGVTIGDGCVIGAGAVVTKDIPANSLAVGNPAKVIKTIEQN